MICGVRDFDQRVEQILGRAHQMADEPLEGIDEAAKELAALAGGDVAIVARIRQVAADNVDAEPDRHNKQVLSLVRRAIEIGRWDWDAYEATPVD
jgi:hypothetical protein